MKFKQIAAAFMASVAVLIFMVGISVLTQLLDESLAGKCLMLAVLLVWLGYIGLLAWVRFERNDADEP